MCEDTDQQILLRHQANVPGTLQECEYFLLEIGLVFTDRVSIWHISHVRFLQCVSQPFRLSMFSE